MSAANDGLQVLPLTRVPMINPGDDLGNLVLEAIDKQGIRLEDDDILVFAQKIVSKAEGRIVRLADVEPSDAARELARKVDKDARIVELILRESVAVIRSVPGVIIVRHKLGLVSANAGIDQSNVDQGRGECALLLPENPDRSARELRRRCEAASGRRLGTIICDSVNRPWRLGSVSIAIGSSGIAVLDDKRGEVDIFGRTLKTTVVSVVDAVATAASLAMGETIERTPCAIVRGVNCPGSEDTAADCIRPIEQDLFAT